jgi:hypothetical protein
MRPDNDPCWPALPYEAWKDTYATLHLCSQVVGKIALALSPPLNHCWGVALRVTPRGLTTRPLPHGERTFTLQFDFIDHCLLIRASMARRAHWRFSPRSVAIASCAQDVGRGDVFLFFWLVQKGRANERPLAVCSERARLACAFWLAGNR